KLAQHQLEAAESNLLLAREAVDEMYTKVARGLHSQPHMQLFERDVLEKALRFYQQFAERKSGDPAIQRETAAALLRVGRIQFELGRRQQARQACAGAIAALEMLAAALPADAQRRTLLAEACSSYGEIHVVAGRHSEGERSHRQALSLWANLL